MRILKFLSMIGVCILMMCTPVKAEITPALLQEWARQPNNVQWNLYYQHTNIQVVDQLPWVSPDLAQTWAYTTMNVNGGYVYSIDMVIKRGYESALTHEVGHALSVYAHIPYWWATNPAFQPIWQTEKYNCALLVGQGENDIREYFAEAYNLYINYPQILRKCCPMTYNYITVVLRYT